MNTITKSRNQREGRYAGWRVTGGRHMLNWHCKQINHERAGGHPRIAKCISLKTWERLQKGSLALSSYAHHCDSWSVA